MHQGVRWSSWRGMHEGVGWSSWRGMPSRRRRYSRRGMVRKARVSSRHWMLRKARHVVTAPECGLGLGAVAAPEWSLQARFLARAFRCLLWVAYPGQETVVQLRRRQLALRRHVPQGVVHLGRHVDPEHGRI